MPSARLLALAPAPGQQLFLRGASATAATGGGGGGSSNSDSRLVHRHGGSSASSRPARSGGWCRCASTMVVPTFPLSLALHTRATARRPIHTARVASFGTATLPKQVAFPRHGKAVEPLSTDEHGREKQPHSAKTGKRATRKTNRRSKIGTAASSSSSSSKAKEDAVAATMVADAMTGTRSAPSPGAVEAEAEGDSATKEVETEEEAVDEAEAEEDTYTADVEAAEPAATTTEPLAQPIASAELDRASLAANLPSVAIDAQKELGRDIEAGTTKDATLQSPSSPLAYSENVVGLAADAAAAAASEATAAEPTSVAAGIVNDSLVIELGPPNPGMGAISGPGESGSSSPPNPERIALPASLRQPLSQKPPPPHLVPPPYVHHFNSYSLVRQLEAGGYMQAQAITAMKGVRLLLAQNLDMAQSSLVSKSDVENEAYLFKAACAELSIEVQNNRRRADEQIRQQRTLLQSEVDIAAQSVNQELVALTDVVKGLFNDRKMAVREEQRTLESAVQQLNYKITIMLNSEMRSEIEALRWVLIRRSVLGIIFMVMLTLGSLRYVSYVSHEKKKQADQAARQAREAEMQRYADTKIDSSSPPDAAEILAAN